MGGDAITGCITSGSYDSASDAGPSNAEIYWITGRRR